MRVYDLADPARPLRSRTGCRRRRAGQPVPQLNDLFVDDTGLIWVTDRIGGGLYVLAAEASLAALMARGAASSPGRGPVPDREVTRIGPGRALTLNARRSPDATAIALQTIVIISAEAIAPVPWSLRQGYAGGTS